MSELHRRRVAEGRRDGGGVDLINHRKETHQMDDQTAVPVDGGEQLPGPDPSPPDPDDPPTPTPDMPPEGTDVPSPLSGRLRAPADTRGVYVVLMARKPKRGDHARPAYTEVGFYSAANPQKAKEAARDDARVGEFLKRSAAQKPGILLRAVPAMHWPDTVEPTRIELNPQLVIG